MDQGKSITLQNVRKAWGETVSLRGIDLEILAGQFTAILGPSGCGKSTSLRVIAGLEDVTSGRVLIGDQDVTAMSPAQRNLSMVFQSYALFPHLSVAENIVFGLKVARMQRQERLARLAEVAELLELTPYLDRKPAALSGGQQQRVALGRAVVSRRPVCLMDEPLSNLDARLRDEMRREIRKLQQALGFTMVYVTHDQTEAITMADQVVLMNQGQIEQVATPQQIYAAPATPFAARFIGTPPMNLLPPSAFGALLDKRSEGVQIGVRPEVLSEDRHGAFAATVRSAEFLGADTLVELDANGAPLLAKLAGNRSVLPGEELRFSVAPSDIHVFDVASNGRLDDPALVARIAGAQA
ncbi:ATP-binding cassette domain-containing protein [Epibacterium sp. SM1979]|uniref:ATP-binding cassette domain-containing protein n=1 Tax=Tritonibacter litoralis TaxID=2662264 RepID=A0A843YEE3_9RHOB|nr:ABC transporter ATP-binding protein [Tritonibacter litoralis]MQQ09780.1 ATP-binding cassette domain-containing protein [Tritonibacter litoralis]